METGSFSITTHLQTLLEWGWVGGLLWGLLFFGAIFAGLRAASTGKNGKTTTRGGGVALFSFAIRAGDIDVAGSEPLIATAPACQRPSRATVVSTCSQRLRARSR